MRMGIGGGGGKAIAMPTASISSNAAQPVVFTPIGGRGSGGGISLPASCGWSSCLLFSQLLHGPVLQRSLELLKILS